MGEGVEGFSERLREREIRVERVCAKKGNGKHCNDSEPFPIRITETDRSRETTGTANEWLVFNDNHGGIGGRKGRKVDGFLTAQDNGNGGG